MTQDEIVKTLLDFIATDGIEESDFNQVALDLFSYQFEKNRPFQSFCRYRGCTPSTVKTWKRIPAVPVEAFKTSSFSCSALEEAERVFWTSGTTQNESPGKSFHPTIEVYDISVNRTFKRFFMQDLEQIRMGIIFPSEGEMPHSSLAHYFALSKKHFGTKDSKYFMGAQTGIDFGGLFADLASVVATGEPYALLGASYSFVPLIDEMDRQNKCFKLPNGSRIFDTGGFKGRSREIAPSEFYDKLSHFFGIPRSLCINMYGMTELSTQLYDFGNEVSPSVKHGPHWIRTRVVNPLTEEDVPKGEVGVLVHCDLAHFNSVSTILTEDMGVIVDEGFLLAGRAEGADGKGCSVAVEEFLSAIGRLKE
tara:strand:+ start:611 stop:1702 length:1092 start_codon:yes stop_codon:yes gene_type:complete